MPTESRVNPSCPRLLALASACLATQSLVLPAQTPAEGSATSAHERMARFEKHRVMLQERAFGDVGWQFLGPTNISGRVTDVAIAKAGETYYIAGASGGVWKTTDNGKTFAPVFEHGPSTSIGDVTVAPSNPEIVWIGTGEANIFRSSMAGCGVFKSTDGGKNWQHMGLAGTHTIPRIVIHPKDPETLYVSASGHEWTDNSDRGIYKSTDGGKTWDRVFYIDERTGSIDLVMHPTDPNTLFTASWQRIRRRYNDPRNEEGYGKSAIYKTTDGGKNWQKLDQGLPPARWRGRIGLDICRTKPDVVYAFIDNYELAELRIRGRDSYGRQRGRTIKGAEVYRSEDGGKSFRKTSTSNRYMASLSSTYGWVFGQIRVDPNNADKIYVMGIHLHVSENAGKSFRRIRTWHGDHHALWIDPTNSDHLINGHDGGANISTDGGKTWRVFTEQMPMVQFFNVNYDMAKPFRVYGSIQDHGSRRGIVHIDDRDNIPAVAWTRAPGGEGSCHWIDPKDPNTVYSASFYGKVFRNDLASRETQPLLPKLATDEERRGQWLAPFMLSHHDNKVFYHGMNRLYRSAERGDNLTPISPDLTYNDDQTKGDIPYHTIFTIAESYHKAGELYVGTDDGRVWHTPNTGKTWNELSAGVQPHRWISRLETSRFENGTVYMAQNGKRNDDFTPYLWKSTNHGRSWQSIVANIPIGPINVVREDPKNKNILYVGTDLGVYISTNGGRNWSTLQQGLPSTFVSDLVIHPRDDIIVISTHGRGMYAMDARKVRRLAANSNR